MACMRSVLARCSPLRNLFFEQLRALVHGSGLLHDMVRLHGRGGGSTGLSMRPPCSLRHRILVLPHVCVARTPRGALPRLGVLCEMLAVPPVGVPAGAGYMRPCFLSCL